MFVRMIGGYMFVRIFNRRGFIGTGSLVGCGGLVLHAKI